MTTSLASLALLEVEVDRVLADLCAIRKDETSPLLPLEDRLTAALQTRWRRVTAGAIDRLTHRLLPKTRTQFNPDQLRRFIAELAEHESAWALGLSDVGQRWIESALDLGVLLALQGRVTKASLPQADLDAITSLISDQFEDIGTGFYTRFVQPELRDLVNDFLQFETPSEDEYLELRRNVLSAFDAQGPWRTLANLTTSRAVQAGTLEMANVVGVRSVTWVSPGARDGLANTCPVCLEMHGRVFTVGALQERLAGILSATPDNLSAVAPFPALGQVRGRTTRELEHAGFGLPPIHPSCYSDDTEMLTRSGWKYIRDVQIGELALSLDPKTLGLEYVPVVQTVSRPCTSLIQFVNRNLDLLVTDDHEMLYQPNRSLLRFKPAVEFLGQKHGRFFASSNWLGRQGATSLSLGRRVVSLETYSEFMGWFLSEGSCTPSRRGRVVICQDQRVHPKNCAAIQRLLDTIGLKYRVTNTQIIISDMDLWSQLLVFGKSFEKFVPDVIKDAPPGIIGAFLATYCLGDGSVLRNTDKKRLGRFRPSRMFFTSSEKMAADLGELIIKVGHRPSYSLRLPRATNTRVVSRRPNWKIFECKSAWHSLGRMSIRRVPYEGQAVCVQLAKFHTLLVRRRGKVVWAGNCRCFLVFASDDEILNTSTSHPTVPTPYGEDDATIEQRMGPVLRDLFRQTVARERLDPHEVSYASSALWREVDIRFHTILTPGEQEARTLFDEWSDSSNSPAGALLKSTISKLYPEAKILFHLRPSADPEFANSFRLDVDEKLLKLSPNARESVVTMAKRQAAWTQWVYRNLLGQETVTVYRGVKPAFFEDTGQAVPTVGETGTLIDNALSSWTTSLSQALRFAGTRVGGFDGAVFKADVPVEQVFASWQTANSVMAQVFQKEREVLLIGGRPLRYQVVASAGKTLKRAPGPSIEKTIAAVKRKHPMVTLVLGADPLSARSLREARDADATDGDDFKQAVYKM